MKATIHIDGAARGNPGPAAYAYIIERDGQPPVEGKACMGRATNNVAEYSALVQALEEAARLGAKRLTILSDSDLLVRQMNGEYQVKNAHLRTLFNLARGLVGRFDDVTIEHIPRRLNARADRLCNEALDGVRKSSGGPHLPSAPPAAAARAAGVREQAVECLQAAASAWKQSGPGGLSAEQVWDQLWSILEEHGALHPSLTRR